MLLGKYSRTPASPHPQLGDARKKEGAILKALPSLGIGLS